MRELLPVPRPDVDVHEVYGRDWDAVGGLRVNFVSGADGGAAVAGRSRGLQTPGDNAVFAALRDLADVVLVGAGTATAEGYRPVTPSGDRLAIRRAHGYPDALPIAVVSAQLSPGPTSGLFTGSGPRTLVLTCASAPGDRRAALERVADVIDCGDTSVDPTLVRRALETRGLGRIVCEGGPSLFADFAEAGAVDELCLSLSPMLTGPQAPRVVAGPDGWQRPLPMSLAGLLEQDGALFLRYRLTR